MKQSKIQSYFSKYKNNQEIEQNKKYLRRLTEKELQNLS